MTLTHELLYVLADGVNIGNWQRAAMRAVDAKKAPPEFPAPFRRPGEAEPVDMTAIRAANWRARKQLT